jgi:hypothetical protein
VRTRRTRFWTGIGVATLATSAGGQLSRAAEPARDAPTKSSATVTGKPAAGPGRGGETYLSDGGPSDSRVRYIRDVTLIAGQMIAADELAAIGRWDEARVHLIDQTADMRDTTYVYMQRHGMPPLATNLALATDALEERNAQAYASARRALDGQLRDASDLVRKFATPYHRFVLRGIVEALKAAAGAYEAALDGDTIVSQAEYREARGYLLACTIAFGRIKGLLVNADATVATVIEADLKSLVVDLPHALKNTMAPLSGLALSGRVDRIVEMSAAFK